MPMNRICRAAQRAAFSAAIDVAINAVRGKGTEKLSENAVKLVNLAEPLLKDRYPASAFDAARKFVSEPQRQVDEIRIPRHQRDQPPCAEDERPEPGV